MWTWNEFLLALIMIQDEEMRTAPLALSYFAGNKRYGDPAITAAAAIWVALPVLIVYIFLQRRFISGMVTGANKRIMIKKFNNQEDLAKNLALFILTKIKRKKKFVLGCPGGRSLKKTYYYLGVLSSKLKISLDHLIIIMMDEYVEKKNNRYQLVDSNAHYSCVRFSRKVIKKLINFKKPLKHRLKDQNIFLPTIIKPFCI